MPPERTGPGSGRSRRDLLRAGAGLLSAGAASSVAGCTEALPPLGGRVQYGRVDVPPAAGDPAAYRQWLAAPSAFESTPTGYDTVYATPGRMGPSPGRPFRFPETLAAGLLDYVGIDYGAFERVILSTGPASVVEVRPDRAAVADVLAGSGYEPAGSYRGYDLFERGDVPRAVAVGDRAIVFANGEAPTDDVAVPIDAREGRVERYHAADPRHARVTGAAGSDPMTWVIPDPAGPARNWNGMLPAAQTLSYRFDDDAVYFVEHWLYPEGLEVTEREIRGVLEEQDRPREAVEVDLDLEGQLATVEMRGDPYRLFEGSDPDVEIPQTTWGLDHDPSAGTVTVRHEAGDAIPADRLSLEYGFEDGGTAAFADEHDVVGPGDEFAVADEAFRRGRTFVGVVYDVQGDTRTTLLSHHLEAD